MKQYAKSELLIVKSRALFDGPIYSAEKEKRTYYYFKYYALISDKSKYIFKKNIIMDDLIWLANFSNLVTRSQSFDIDLFSLIINVNRFDDRQQD